MRKIYKALQFAVIAHDGQKRKYTNEPYIVHPIEVSGLIAEATGDEDMIIAGLFHDVIEDTKFTYDDIMAEFGKNIADLVMEVTDVSKPSDGNREERKRIDREHIAKASQEGKTIKLADLISNTSSIVKYDRNFAKIYLKEKELLLEVLSGGSEYLYDIAVETLNDAKKLMEN